jgi:hypothetical protein
MTGLFVSAVYINNITVLHDIKVMSTVCMWYHSVLHLSLPALVAAPVDRATM